jgi:hypothetical protein
VPICASPKKQDMKHNRHISISLNPQKTVFILGTVVLFLILSNIVGLISKYYLRHDYVFGLIPLFDLDGEGNIPTYFSSAIILLSAGLLAIIFVLKKRQDVGDHRYWAGLSGIFLFLSIDEFACIHERLIFPLKNFLNTYGVLYFAWVIPYSILLFILVLLYHRFIFSLPLPVRRLFIVAGLVYIGGALGFELIGGYYFDLNGARKVLLYEIITMVEESLEMAGILIFIYALIQYAGSAVSNINLKISLPSMN